jgi:hypothetical protein
MVHTGRHFLQIPGPTNVPDRVLGAGRIETVVKKMMGDRAPRPSQRKRGQKSRHGIAVVMPPASSD